MARFASRESARASHPATLPRPVEPNPRVPIALGPADLARCGCAVDGISVASLAPFLALARAAPVARRAPSSRPQLQPVSRPIHSFNPPPSHPPALVSSHLIASSRSLLSRSILHPPGEDNFGYESASERWLPVHTVESIMVSVISMLSSPNDESPANIDAAKEWREDPEAFRKRVARCVRKSQDSL